MVVKCPVIVSFVEFVNSDAKTTPKNQKHNSYKSKYIWISHCHPDHLDLDTLIELKNAQILVPDHFNDRIYNDLTKLGSNVVSLANPVNAISNYEYETIRNEEKRNIFVLKSGFLQQFLDDIKEIMVYDESTQRIDDTTAQTENLNISMP